MRRSLAIAALLSLVIGCQGDPPVFPGVVGQAQAVTYWQRDYSITQDTYLDEGGSGAMNEEGTIVYSAANIREKYPMMTIAATALGAGESLDSAEVIVHCTSSAVSPRPYYVYRIIPTVDYNNADWATPDGIEWWQTAGALGALDRDLTLGTLYTYTPPQPCPETLVIARGATFSSWVGTAVVGSSQVIIFQDNSQAGGSWTAYSAEEGDESLRPILRLYGHTTEASTSTRRRAMTTE